MKLAEKSCVPCRGGVPPLSRADAERFLRETPLWQMTDEVTRISRRYGFDNFAQALQFVQKVAELAESEGHHPDILFGWGYAEITFYTHKIKGLHENDFVMAAKVDAIVQADLG